MKTINTYISPTHVPEKLFLNEAIDLFRAQFRVEQFNKNNCTRRE